MRVSPSPPEYMRVSVETAGGILEAKRALARGIAALRRLLESDVVPRIIVARSSADTRIEDRLRHRDLSETPTTLMSKSKNHHHFAEL